MRFNELEIPSNKSFGLFFTFVFLILSLYFWLTSHLLLLYFFGILAFIFLLLSYYKSRYLNILNRTWMYFGYLIGNVVSFFILLFLFFLIFTPVSYFMKIIQRDELKLQGLKSNTFWEDRNEDTIKPKTFDNQF